MANSGLYQRVDKAIERGERWRAKEMLRGSIRSQGYDVELYERYGRLLLDLQDKLEAGKYLLLSGNHKPEYESAIELYLSRTRGDALYYSFPRSARLRSVSDYPCAVQSCLKRSGFGVAKWRCYDDSSLGLGCWTAVILTVALAIAVIVFAGLGVWVTVKWWLS